MSSSPIRVAIIGLSANSTTSWGASTHFASLNSPEGRSRFQIAALCNSTKEAAEKAIKAFGLPAEETRAYGSPEELAADADIQLVVCVTRVDKHYETTMPSIKAGKDVFVEWPLAENAARIDEMVKAARAAGGKTIVGLQGRHLPPVRKLKELVESGRIGKVVSSEVSAANWGGAMRDALPSGFAYFTERTIGGNFITIAVAHALDQVQNALGELTDVRSNLQLARPNLNLVDGEGKKQGTTISDVPDIVHLQSRLAPSPHVVPGATLTFSYSRVAPFPGGADLVWTILGDKGAVRLTSPGTSQLQLTAIAGEVVVDLHDFGTGSVERVGWAWDRFDEQPEVARNFSCIYEAYADGKAEAYPDFEYAVRRNAQLEALFAGWDAEKKL